MIMKMSVIMMHFRKPHFFHTSWYFTCGRVTEGCQTVEHTRGSKQTSLLLPRSERLPSPWRKSRGDTPLLSTLEVLGVDHYLLLPPFFAETRRGRYSFPRFQIHGKHVRFPSLGGLQHTEGEHFLSLPPQTQGVVTTCPGASLSL